MCLICNKNTHKINIVTLICQECGKLTNQKKFTDDKKKCLKCSKYGHSLSTCRMIIFIGNNTDLLDSEDYLNIYCINCLKTGHLHCEKDLFESFDEIYNKEFVNRRIKLNDKKFNNKNHQKIKSYWNDQFVIDSFDDVSDFSE